MRGNERAWKEEHTGEESKERRERRGEEAGWVGGEGEKKVSCVRE